MAESMTSQKRVLDRVVPIKFESLVDPSIEVLANV
jgi:hypothetical protein